MAKTRIIKPAVVRKHIPSRHPLISVLFIDSRRARKRPLWPWARSLLPPCSASPSVRWGQTLCRARKNKGGKETEHFVRSPNWVFGPKQEPFIRPLLPLGPPNWLPFPVPPSSCVPPPRRALSPQFLFTSPRSLILIYQGGVNPGLKGKWWRYLWAPCGRSRNLQAKVLRSIKGPPGSGRPYGIRQRETGPSLDGGHSDQSHQTLQHTNAIFHPPVCR